MKKLTLAILSLLTVGAAGVHGQITISTDFEGGAGTTLPNEFRGAAGDGWSGGWQNGDRTSGNLTSATLTDVAPIGGTYSLLMNAFDDSSGGASRTNVSREWDAAAAASNHTVSFDFKVNTFDAYNQYGDFLQFMALDSHQSSANFNNSAWGFRINGGTNAIVVRNGGTNTNITDVTFSTGTVYNVFVNVDMGTSTFDFTLTDTATSDTQTLTGLAFTGAYDALKPANFFHFGTSTQSDGVTPVTIEAAMDNLVIAIPEPSIYAALLGALALGVVFWRRRR